MSSTLRETPRRVLRAVAAVLLTGGVLAACGSGDDASEAGASDGGVTTVTAERSGGGQFQPAILAQRLGYLEDAGLEVTYTVGSGNPSAAIPLLLNNQLQFAMLDGAAMVRAAAEGIPVSFVGGVQSSNPDIAPSDGLLVPAGSGIDSLDDLKGATIGTSAIGGTPQIVNDIALKAAGVDPASVEYVQLPVDSLVSSAQSGQVDAILSFAHFYAQAVSAGFTPLTKGSGVILPRTPQVAWAASDQYIAKNPEVVEGFAAALDKANEYANANQDKIRAIDHELTQLPAEYIDNRVIQPFSSEINADALLQLAEAMKEQGLVESVPAIEDMVWSEAPQG